MKEEGKKGNPEKGNWLSDRRKRKRRPNKQYIRNSNRSITTSQENNASIKNKAALISGFFMPGSFIDIKKPALGPVY